MFASGKIARQCEMQLRHDDVSVKRLNLISVILDSFHLFAENQSYYRYFSIKVIWRPSHVCFILRYSSNWNPHRLHEKPFLPKEKHNVGPFVSMTITTTPISVLRRFEYLAERSNVLDHYNTVKKLVPSTYGVGSFIECQTIDVKRHLFGEQTAM
jgi:hypothetical protein